MKQLFSIIIFIIALGAGHIPGYNKKRTAGNMLLGRSVTGKSNFDLKLHKADSGLSKFGYILPT